MRRRTACFTLLFLLPVLAAARDAAQGALLAEDLTYTHSSGSGSRPCG